MRKTILLCLLLALTLSISNVAFAIDLTELTDDELMELPVQIAEEQLSRGLVKSASLGAGSYVIGTDIPAGNYTAKNNGKYSLNLAIYDSDNHLKYNIALWKTDDKTGKLELEDGDVIENTDSIELAVYTGITWS